MDDKTEHVEILRGRGQLVLPDFVDTVEYSIRVFQAYKAVGRLDRFNRDDIVFSVLAGQSLELVLEDGRRAKILLAGLDGDFEVTWPIEPKGT